MRSIKLILTGLTYLLLSIGSQPLFAQKNLQLHESNVMSSLKDTVEVEFYEVKNKDLMLVLDSIMNEWKKSRCYLPEYYLEINTFPLTKSNGDIVENPEDICQNEFYWEITIRAFESVNFVDRSSWGCLRYKNRLFVLRGRPCNALFSPLKKEFPFEYYRSSGNDIHGIFSTTIMRWEYNYCDNKFVLTHKRGCDGTNIFY